MVLHTRLGRRIRLLAPVVKPVNPVNTVQNPMSHRQQDRRTLGVRTPAFCPKRRILAGLIKFLAVGYGLNELSPMANTLVDFPEINESD
jgi:hypothetical protein